MASAFEESVGASAGILARLRAFSRVPSTTQNAKLRFYHEFFLHGQRFLLVKQARNLIERVMRTALFLTLFGLPVLVFLLTRM